MKCMVEEDVCPNLLCHREVDTRSSIEARGEEIR
jgi:hypothetical protein